MVKADGGGMRPVLLTLDDYVHRAGPRLERDGFFEHELARQQQVFGDIAQVFSTYACRHAAADPQPFLRGIHSLQLARTGGQWRVLQILWEQEVDAGPIPREFLAGVDPAAALLPLRRPACGCCRWCRHPAKPRCCRRPPAIAIR